MRVQRIVVASAASTILVVVLAASSSPAARDQNREATIARAMQAAPRSIAEHATIRDADGTVLRIGSNGWTCMPASGPGSTHPMCADQVWMQFGDALARKAPFRTDRIGISYMLAGDDNVNNADPFDTHQDPGESWVQEGPHLMILVPDQKMLDGLSHDPDNGGPYVMWGGTSYAHIMVPLGPRQTNR